MNTKNPAPIQRTESAWTRRLSFFLIVYALFIILWGAFVRFSGSGDGCGEHWPLCYGVLVPDNLSLKMFIEYAHRLKSTLFGVIVIALVWLAFREFPKRHPARYMAVASLFFTVTEGLIGARLVLAGLVGDNASGERAVTISLHLINTFILLACLIACWYFSRSRSWEIREISRNSKLKLWSSFAVFLLIAISGSLASLSNTLYPSPDLLSGLRDDFAADSPLLLRLRLLHPLFSISGFFLLFIFIVNLKKEFEVRLKLVDLFPYFIIANFALGLGLIAFLSPLYGKLLHLLLADLIWLGLCLTGLSLLYRESKPIL